jgi:hypothetical protein
MRTRLLLGSIGVALALYGALLFVGHDLSRVVDAVLWLAGGVVVHDALVAPATIAVTVLGTRVLPQRVWAVVTAGLVVLLTVTVSAIPVLGSWGARADNPTLLDREYAAGWLVFAAVVLVVSLLAVPWRRLVARDHGTAPDPEEGE